MESSTARVEHRLQRWQGKLVDMSLRNRLLNLPESACLRPLSPDIAPLFDRLVAKEALLRCRFDTAKDGDVLFSAEAEKPLVAMRRKARSAKQDQGFNALHMAFGLLEWIPPDTHKPTMAPLLLAPVDIERRGQLADHALRMAGGELLLNPALVLKLETDLGMILPPLPPAERLDIESFFRQIEVAISAQAGWKVHRSARLGLFTFNKLVMYMDLKANSALAARHPLIKALAGDPSGLGERAAAPKAEELDRLLDARASFSVLDADSSQQEAVEAVRGGGSVVLQGPPGTGKSQTITNVIAECMAMGKSVLFVSEKMAALDVVKARLRTAGLGDFCLELHDNSLARAEVVARIAIGLDALPEEGRDDLAALDEVNALKLRLDAYAQAMHRPRGGLQLSAYQAMGELASLAGTKHLVFRFDGAMTVDAQRMMSMLTGIDRLEGMHSVMATKGSHPWRDCDLKDLSFGQQAEVLADLQALALAADQAGAAVKAMAEECRLPGPASIGAARTQLVLVQQAISGPPPVAGWLSGSSLPGMLQWAEKEKATLDHLKATEASLMSEYSPSLFALDGKALEERFERDHASGLRAISGSYRQDMRSISSALRKARDLGYEEGLKVARDLAAYQADLAWLNAHAEQDAAHYGPYFQGPATNWDNAIAALRFAQGILDISGEPDEATKQFLTGGKAATSSVRQSFIPAAKAMTILDLAMERMGRYMRDGRLDIADDSPSKISLAGLSAWSRDLERNADRLREWIDLLSAEEECRRLGLEDMLCAAYRDLSPGAFRHAFRQRFLQIFLDEVMREEALLRDFNAQEQASLVDRFRKADNLAIEGGRNRLRRQLKARLLQERPATSAVKVQEALLRKEMGKRGRWKPTRELLVEIPDLLAVLKPCILMSPMSVSQFLEPSLSFDVLVFDEASQIAPEDALCAIMRCRQVVVVGDSMQLPPTRFFEASADEEYLPTAEDLESILDECASIGLPRKMLLWHYRSRHESLIAFSNQHFYGDRLSTFPAAKLAKPGLGVEFVPVAAGVYDRGGRRDNVLEAKKVAEIAMAHAAANPQLSLGVVAFSEPQQDAIIDAIEAARHGRREVEAFFDENKQEAFFVKNLENVQGDERDVMLFSVGYGRDKEGRMIQGYGPLNLEGGERRLNVAITRARSNVKLVSSINSSDVVVDASSPKGVVALRDYLDYAQKGGIGARTAAGQAVERDLLVESISKALQADGLKVVTGLGSSSYKVDLAIVEEESGRYLLGIECEGAYYMNGRTSRDRERLRQQVLANLGWDVIRIWTRDWVQDRAREVERVRAALAKARDRST